MAFVLDASVTMRWLTKDGTIADLAYANFILDKFLEPNVHVHVPSHWPLEITNVMLRSERKGLIDKVASENFLDTLKLAPVMVDLAAGARAFDDTLAIARYHRLPLTTRHILNSLCASPRHLPRSTKTFTVPPNRRVLSWRKKGRVSPAFTRYRSNGSAIPVSETSRKIRQRPKEKIEVGRPPSSIKFHSDRPERHRH